MRFEGRKGWLIVYWSDKKTNFIRLDDAKSLKVEEYVSYATLYKDGRTVLEFPCGYLEEITLAIKKALSEGNEEIKNKSERTDLIGGGRCGKD